MSNNKVDRLSELNKLWFRLHVPKKGDEIKFRIGKNPKLYKGKLIEMTRHGNQIRYKMSSEEVNTFGRQDIVIVECNGIKFEASNIGETQYKDFKPL